MHRFCFSQPEWPLRILSYCSPIILFCTQKLRDNKTVYDLSTQRQNGTKAVFEHATQRQRRAQTVFDPGTRISFGTTLFLVPELNATCLWVAGLNQVPLCLWVLSSYTVLHLFVASNKEKYILATSLTLVIGVIYLPGISAFCYRGQIQPWYLFASGYWRLIQSWYLFVQIQYGYLFSFGYQNHITSLYFCLLLLKDFVPLFSCVPGSNTVLIPLCL